MITVRRLTSFTTDQFIRCQRYLYRLFSTDWMQRWVRFGHGAKGLLYGAIGFIAIRAVVYDAESAGGSEQVMAMLNDRALGSLALLLLCIGLAGYSFWRLVQVVVDPEHIDQPLTLQRIAQRCGYTCRE